MKAPVPNESPNSVRQGNHGPNRAKSFVRGRNKNKRAGRKYPKLFNYKRIRPRSRHLRPGMRVQSPDGKKYVVGVHGQLVRVSSW